MKNIIFVLPAGSLPVPAINGGAIETLVNMLVDENEKSNEFMFHLIMCKKVGDTTVYNYDKYKNTKFYDFYMSPFDYKMNRLMNAGNKRLNYSLPLYSPFDKFVSRKVKEIKPDFVVYEGSYTSALRLLKKQVGREKLAYHVHHQIIHKIDISKFFSKIICVSEFIRKDWVDNFKCKNSIDFEVLPNTVDEENFGRTITKKERKEIRESLGFTDKDYVVIFVGRLIKEKGIEELITAIKNIENKNIKLLILGESLFKNSNKTPFTEHLCEISKGLEDRIKFTGFIGNDVVYKYYASSDLHVAPSTCEEAAALVVIESKMVGLPQVVTNSGGLPEFVRSDATILVKESPDFIQNLSNAIEERSKIPTILKPEKNEKFKKSSYYQNFSKMLNSFTDVKK